MTIPREIVASVRDNRDMTESEKVSFGLSQITANIRHWLKWTKEQRDKEGLTTDENSNVNFPVDPGYRQFERWAHLLEEATDLIRVRTTKSTDNLEPYENKLSIEELRREVRWLWDSQRMLMSAIRDKADMPPPRVLKDLSSAAKWPDDKDIGRMLQRKYGIEIIPPVSECENGAGVWSRMLAGLNDNEGIGCLNMLVLCGELGGKQPGETYPQYLRRLIDFIAAQPREYM